MAGMYTDEERLAKGQYQDASGQWYTSSGYKVSENGNLVSSSPSYSYQQTVQPTVNPNVAVQTGARTGIVQKNSTGSASGYPFIQGEYSAYSTNPYAEEAIAAQKAANEAILAQFSEQQRQANAQRDAALAQSVNNYRNQQKQIEKDAEAASRQAYITKMLDQRDLNQRLIASGYSGGLTDTANLRLLSGYENSRNSILNQRNQQLSDIDLAIANARAQAESDRISDETAIAIAQAKAQAEGNEALSKLYASMRESAARSTTGVSGRGSGGGDESAYAAADIAQRIRGISPGVASVLDGTNGNFSLKEAYTGTSNLAPVDPSIKTPSDLLNSLRGGGGITNRTQALEYVNANGGGTRTSKVMFIEQARKNGTFGDDMANWLMAQIAK